jgi:hypothetical protein
VAAVGEHPGIRARKLGKGWDDGEVELLGETEVRLVERTDHLTAELHDASIGQGRLLHAAAGAIPRLHDQDVRARLHQVACGAEAGKPGAHDDHVAFHGGHPFMSATDLRGPDRGG